jgi:hypothetical protein
MIIEVPPSENGVLLLRSIARAYYEESVVQRLTVLENYDATRDAEVAFSQIGIRVTIPRQDMEKTDRVLLVDDLGRSVALGERNYLRHIWGKSVSLETLPASEFNADGFQSVLEKLSGGTNSTALLAPIEKYVEMAGWIRNTLRPFRWDSGGMFFILGDGRELKIIWSNVYAPLDHFILVDPSATHWIVKPDMKTKNRLTAMFVENENDPAKIDFYIKTTVGAQVINTGGIRFFRFGETLIV